MSPEPPARPRRSAAEERAHGARRLRLVRLRFAIGRELDNRGITTPAAIAEALGMPAAEATALLARRHSREGDLAKIEAAAARLGVQPSCRR
jgi:hypothetical protein